METLPTDLLRMENITKDFPRVRALEAVSFSLEPQSVHAIVGQNGAGKSTLISAHPEIKAGSN